MEHTEATRFTTERNKTKKWLTPAYCDVRLGFEVTAYVYVR